MNAVATLPTPRRSVTVSMAERYGMDPAAFEATVRATCMPATQPSKEQFAAFLLVAKEHNLNPLTREIFAFPAKGGGIQPIVSIDGWARIINEHPQLDGVEFVDIREGSDLIAVECRIHRKDRSRPTSVIEYMAECRRSTDVWRQWPARMLRHKALIQCARYAFGFSGIVDPDEYERMVNVTPPRPETRRLHADFDDPAAEPASDAEFTGPTPAPEETPSTAVPPSGEGQEGEALAQGEPPPSTPVPEGMKTGADLLREKEQAPAEDFDPLEWKAEAERYVDMAEDVETLKALDQQWTQEGLWDRLKKTSRTDWQDLVGRMGARDRELRQAEAAG
jgi:phage recombination protein Bet